MIRKVETNDAGRITQLSNLIEHAEISGPDGSRIFTESLVSRLAESHRQLIVTRETHNATLSRLREARSREDLEKEKLIQTVRNAWNTVLSRVKAFALPASRMSLYGLSASGKRPTRGDTRRWISLANQVIAGDTEAENLGIQPLGEPDRETIQQQIDLARQHQLAAETEKARLAVLRKDLKRMRTEAVYLIREAILAVESAHRNDEPVTRRNKMRVLGFQFETPTETETETEPIAEAS